MQHSQHDHDYYIHTSLIKLGVMRWNKSSRRLERALRYIIENDVIPEQPVKCLYADLAKAQKCKWNTVERSLRYAVNSLWNGNQVLCSKLFYWTDDRLPCPSVSDFLSLYLSAYQRGVIKEWVDISAPTDILPDTSTEPTLVP